MLPGIARGKSATIKTCMAGSTAKLRKAVYSWLPIGGGKRSGTARSSKPECLTDPGTLVLVGLQALRLHQGIGILVPATVGKIVAQHSRRGLRLVHNAQCHIGLGK